jgi:flagellar assembly factor FliW
MDGLVKRQLEVEDSDKLDLLIILTIPNGQPQEMTGNFLGPVAINARTRLAQQVLLDPAEHDPCSRIFK